MVANSQGMPVAPGKDGGDLSLDAEEFSSDFFRIYLFKVKRCPRGRPHDWTQCPYAHPGEKAKRRDPRRYQYSGTACPDFRKNGCCRRGDACPFAHGVFECWLHPARYRTQSCADGMACNRRVCFFAHVETELRKPEDDPTVQNGSQADLAAETQLLQQQQLTNALSALLANGGTGMGLQMGAMKVDGGDSRPLANQLAERARQLQQQLQALQVLQAQQHAAGAQHGQSFDAESAAQAAVVRQALVQQQLQDQVDQELLPLMGGKQLGGHGVGMGVPRQGSPFAPQQSSMEAISLLQVAGPGQQRRRSPELHAPNGGLPVTGSMPGPDMLARGALPAGMGRAHGFRGQHMAGRAPDGFAAGGYPSAAQRRVSLDSALPPRGAGGGLFLNGHHPFSMDGNEAALHAMHCSGLPAASTMSGRSSMEMSGTATPDMLFGGHAPVDGLPGRASLDMAQQNSRGSMELPPLGQRSSFDAGAARAAGNGFNGVQGRRPPQRHSIDLGAVQRQAVMPHGGLFGPALNGFSSWRGAGASLERLGSEGHSGSSSPSPHGRNSPGLQPVSQAFGGLSLAHLQGVPMNGNSGDSPNPEAGGSMYGPPQPATLQNGGLAAHVHVTQGLSAGEARAHAGHPSGHHVQRLETVGEGEVSRLFANGMAQNFQLLGFGNAKLQGLGNGDTFLPATDSMGYLIRNASFDRILAELPRSLSEVALPPGVSQAAMEGPVRFDN